VELLTPEDRFAAAFGLVIDAAIDIITRLADRQTGVGHRRSIPYRW